MRDITGQRKKKYCCQWQKINETNVLKFSIFIKIKTSCLKNLTKLFLSEKADRDKNKKSANYRME